MEPPAVFLFPDPGPRSAEIRAVIHCFYHRGHPEADYLCEMSKAHGQSVFSSSTICLWYGAFSAEKMTFDDDNRPERPLNRSISTDTGAIFEVKLFASAPYIAERLDEPKDTLLRHVSNGTGRQNLKFRSVSYKLLDDNTIWDVPDLL